MDRSTGGSAILRSSVGRLWRNSVGQPVDHFYGLFSVAGSHHNSRQAAVHFAGSRENLDEFFGVYGRTQELSGYQNRYELADGHPGQSVADDFERRVCPAVGVDRIFS